MVKPCGFMDKDIISSERAPSVSGAPYSPAVRVGQFVFTSGQVSDNPEADIKTQTKQALEKIKALLEAAGTSMDNAIKCTVFLRDINDFASMNEVYKRYFGDKLPARSCVEAKLLKTYKVEIEAIAFIQ